MSWDIFDEASDLLKRYEQPHILICGMPGSRTFWRSARVQDLESLAVFRDEMNCYLDHLEEVIRGEG